MDCLRRDLKKALSLLQPVAGKRDGRSKEVRLTAHGNSIKLSSLDYSGRSAQVKIKGNGDPNDMDFVIPIDTFRDVINICESDFISINDTPNSVNILDEMGINTIRAHIPDFIHNPDPGTNVLFTCNGSKLKQILRPISLCVSEISGNEALRHLSLKCDGHELNIAATDGFRLASGSIPVQGKAFDILIDGRGANDVIRLAEQFDEHMELTVKRNENRVHFLAPDMICTIPIGTVKEFPPYKSILQQKRGSSVVVDKKMFGRAIRSVSHKDSQWVEIRLNEAANKHPGVHMFSKTADAELSRHVRTHIEGPPTKVRVNGKFILDYLKHCGDSIQIDVHDQSTAIKLTDKVTNLIVMPVHFNN